MNLPTKLMMAGLAVTASALSFASAASANPAVSAAVVLTVDDFSTTEGTVNSGGASIGDTELGSLELSAAVGIGEHTMAAAKITHKGDGDSYDAFASAVNGTEFNSTVTITPPETDAATHSVTLGETE